MRVWVGVLILAAISSPAPASSPEMRPITDFIVENGNSTNGGTEVFVGLRCSSLFSILEQYTSNNNMPDASEKYKAASKAALKFALDNQRPFSEEYTVNQLKIMMESYVDRFTTSKARTGNFSDDEVIKSDAKTCGDIF